MSDAEVVASRGQESLSGEDLLEGLPPWMPKHEDTGNFKLLQVVGRSIDRLDNDIKDVDNATNVQTAETIEQIRKLAALVGAQHKQNESREKFRSRTIAAFQTMTTEATPSDVIENAATILDVPPEKISYEETNPRFIELVVPGNALDDLALTSSEFDNVMETHVAAGYRLGIKRTGTFTYITPSDYNNSNHDATKGYDGLDNNNDPKDNGGTYAGFID